MPFSCDLKETKLSKQNKKNSSATCENVKVNFKYIFNNSMDLGCPRMQRCSVNIIVNCARQFSFHWILS